MSRRDRHYEHAYRPDEPKPCGPSPALRAPLTFRTDVRPIPANLAELACSCATVHTPGLEPTHVSTTGQPCPVPGHPRPLRHVAGIDMEMRDAPKVCPPHGSDN